MSEDDTRDDDPRDDPDREAILSRRRRLISVALGGLASVAVAGCGEPEPCLRFAPDAGITDAGMDAEPQPCLTPLPPDAGEDGGRDAAIDDAGADAEPEPCLRFIPDGGE